MAAKKAGRFVLKLLLALGVLVILLVVLMESGIAPRWLLTAAGNKIGLELSAEHMKIGWGGNLHVRRFSAALPDEDAPFFTAHNIEISMNSIPALLTTRSAGLTDIRLVGPVLNLSADEDGQLNIAPLRAIFRDRPDRPESQEPPNIPAVTLINGTVHYQRFGAETITVSRIQFDAFQTDEDTIAFTLSLPGNNTLACTLNTDTLEHALTLCIEDVAALPDPAKEDLPRTFKILADWKGTVESQQPMRLAGDLNIRQLSLDNADASLNAAVVFDSDSAQARIRRLSVNPWPLWPRLENPHAPLTAESGTVTLHFADTLIDINELSVSLLDGQASLNAVLSPQQWFNSRGQVAFNALNISQLIPADVFQDTRLNGSLTIEPATDPRAMEPMAVSLNLHLLGTVFEKAGLHEITANGYLGSDRLVTNGVTVPVFGGRVHPWLSLTRRETEVFTHVIADITDIEVERLANTFTGRTDAIPGKLAGTIRARTSGTLQTLSGSADIVMSESSLINTRIIGAVYSAMNLSFGNLDAKGTAKVKLAAHGEKLEIMSFEYFNRGVEVRGAGLIEAVTRGKDSPVSGFATGSLRPLRETPIPGTRELDRLISGLQAGLATVKIEGTLGHVQPRVVPMPEVQNALRALLWEQLRD